MGGGSEREEERENWRRIERKRYSQVKQDLDEAHVMQVVCDTKETKQM